MSGPSHCETSNYYGGHTEWCENYKELERELQLAESRLKKVTAELEQSRKWAKAWKKSAHFWRDRTCDRIGDQKAHVWYSVWRGFRQGRFD